MDKIDFIIWDKLCEEALIEANSVENKSAWLKKFRPLFESISIKPLDLPSIANQNHNGVRYTYIGDFHFAYIKMQNLQ